MDARVSRIAETSGAPSGEPSWARHYALLDVVLTDGAAASGPLMRRKAGNAWQYRRMTNAEMDDYLAADAW